MSAKTSHNDQPSTTSLTDAVQKFENGQFEDAQKICDSILLNNPEDTNALNLLSGCLARTGHIDQAIKKLEIACELAANNAELHSNLASLYHFNNDLLQAIIAMSLAVIHAPENEEYITSFSNSIFNIAFDEITPEADSIINAIIICIESNKVNHMLLRHSWFSLVKLDPAFKKLSVIIKKTSFQEQAEELDIKELTPLLNSPFFLSGMKNVLMNDLTYEQVMTFLRRFLLHSKNYSSEVFLPFLCALAEQCNFNEYIYPCTKEEQESIDCLIKELDIQPTINIDTMADIALIGCYRELDRLDCANEISIAADTSESDAFKGLVETNIDAPIRVRSLKPYIPAFSPVDNDVSLSVKQQYEENPYPRWHYINTIHLTEQQKQLSEGKSILVAGCGTGQEPISMAIAYPDANIVAIDLSLASLVYGKQKAIELGIDNIEFMHADILELDKLDRQFDMITSCGVIHHMKEPLEGWKKLLSRLKPEGVIKLALYSKIARESVIECRELIKEKGFQSTPEGIRDFRQYIIGLDDGNPIKKIAGRNDFYTMSM
jgi:2-polyprenyl-3-methyl-5-hydroxy-6-metoxy-1,4-benzoquinol methylase